MVLNAALSFHFKNLQRWAASNPSIVTLSKIWSSLKLSVLQMFFWYTKRISTWLFFAVMMIWWSGNHFEVVFCGISLRPSNKLLFCCSIQTINGCFYKNSRLLSGNLYERKLILNFEVVICLLNQNRSYITVDLWALKFIQLIHLQ